MDIGGAEGWFCNFIKENFPKANVINVDPDKNVIKVGKKLYPKVKHICNSLELLNEKNYKDVDIMTFWGGFYRIAEPIKTLRKIKDNTKNNIKFYFTLPFSIEKVVTRQNKESYKSLNEVFGHSTINFYDKYYFYRIICQFFYINKIYDITNLPFPKKIPLFCFSKKNTSKNKILPKKLNYYKFLNKTAIESTKFNFNNILKKDNLRNILILINDDLFYFYKQSFKNSKIKITFIKKNEMYKKVSYFDHIYQNKFDSIFFIDNEFNKKFLENLFVRVHLNKYAKIYYLKNILDKDNFYF